MATVVGGITDLSAGVQLQSVPAAQPARAASPAPKGSQMPFLHYGIVPRSPSFAWGSKRIATISPLDYNNSLGYINNTTV